MASYPKAAQYHQISLMGNLGSDPIMRFTSAGKPVTSLSVAVGDSYKGQDGDWVERTIWVRVTIWGPGAERANQVLSKGMRIFVVGSLVADTETGSPKIWTDQAGNPRTNFEVRADTWKALDRNGGENGNGHSDGTGTSQTASPQHDEGDLPF